MIPEFCLIVMMPWLPWYISYSSWCSDNDVGFTFSWKWVILQQRYVPNKQLALLQTTVLNEIELHTGKYKNIAVSKTVILMFGFPSILSRKCPGEYKQLLAVAGFQQKAVSAVQGSSAGWRKADLCRILGPRELHPGRQSNSVQGVLLAAFIFEKLK